MRIDVLSGGRDRVRANTAREINDRIDRQIQRNIEHFSGADKSEITKRIAELESEWDIERVLETQASTIALTGSLLTAFVSRRFIAVPLFVTGFLLQHAIQGWCPPIPILRRLGVRTRSEIDAEKFALKALRGDFDDLRNDIDMHSRADKAVSAVMEELRNKPGDDDR